MKDKLTKKALFIIEEGFEDMELIITLDILNRAKIKHTIVNVADKLNTTSMAGVTINTEKASYFLNEDFDIVIVPGGKSAFLCAKSTIAKEIVLNQYNKNKYIAAICAGPLVLSKAKILEDKTITCYPDEAIKKQIKAQKIVNDHLCIWENIITAKGPASAVIFGAAILHFLVGNAIMKQVLKDLLFSSNINIEDQIFKAKEA